MQTTSPNIVTLHACKEDEDNLKSIVTEQQSKAAVVLATNDEPLFHEAGVWMPSTKEWIVASNRLKHKSGEPHVIFSAIDVKGDVRTLDNLSSVIPMGNGGTADGKGGAYLCSQGLEDVGGAIYHTADGEKATAVVSQSSLVTCTAEEEDKNVILNSPNDICVYKQEWLLFTDPSYGYEQGFRSKPQSGEFVWVASTDGKTVAPLITSGLHKPNGICLSPDQSILYVTDTAFINGTGEMDPKLPRHVLAYDIHLSEGNGGDLLPIKLTNRRVLFKLYCRQGVPDGIKVDVDGNIYVGAGDGARIFSPSGELIGVLALEGGVANLCFGGDDLRDLLLLNEKKAVLIRMERPGVNLQ
uniref:SMP-30/Gluconolactonase/LRE-like region domain-containing protein n=1 Tax=Helicotheca tamesis TaxID=374047 RepID=A0A7S2HFS3_9STRA|mmetsp:Transcript_17717/g.24405  ORF Transcript_17717/g.24405 Transcript_17717/m.24405 type:complete len:355 (+) Transcript_17717:57-1121(+)